MGIYALISGHCNMQSVLLDTIVVLGASGASCCIDVHL